MGYFLFVTETWEKSQVRIFPRRFGGFGVEFFLFVTEGRNLDFHFQKKNKKINNKKTSIHIYNSNSYGIQLLKHFFWISSISH